jgi:glutamyl-tRNA synthetase
LHLGNVYAFLVTAALAERHGLRIRLRIDDLDRTRFREAYLNDIFALLEALDLPWHDGPATAKAFLAEYSQLHRLDLYDTALQKLADEGKLYACNCSRSDLKDGRHANAQCRARNLSLHEPQYAWRLKLPATASVRMYDWQGQARALPLPTAWSDPVLRRKAEKVGSRPLPAYHLACVVDDVLYGTTHLVRGLDLFESSLLQLHLAEQLEASDFLKMGMLHHPLILGPNGQKLSKSAGDHRKAQCLLVQWGSARQIYQALGEAIGHPLGSKADFFNYFDATYSPAAGFPSF